MDLSIESSDKKDDIVQAQNFYNPLTQYSKRSWRRESVLHLRKTFKELNSKPLPKPFKPRLEGPSVNWDVFKRLSLAETYADKHTKDCMIFSYEDRTPDNAGRRMFLVTHPQHMWLNYKKRPIDHRCTYEVIREKSPCKLYFDLEFKKIQNPGRNGSEMTKIFIQCVIAAMIQVYNIPLQASHFLWLDASTEQKFSSHLIVQIPGYAFKNNVVAGLFVTFLLSQIISRIASNTHSCHLWPSSEELKLLLIAESEEKLLFCDSGVYTKNRNFRLYLSTKHGKKAPLVLSEYNEYIPKDIVSLKTLEETIFYDSLITYFRKEVKNIIFLCEPRNKDNNLVKITPSRGRTFTSPEIETTSFSEKGPSPFPEIDNFIVTQIKDSKVTGFIRKWVYLQKEEILLYDIGNYRYCSNIGRHHKSNNIMLIVDMNQKHFYQKCHDPECRSQNFKSSPKSLPSSVASIYTFSDDFFDANCFTQLRKNSTEMDNLNNSEEETELNNDDILKIDDSFFEECFPFTQCTATSKEENNLKSENNKPDTKKHANLEENESLLEDNYFDDICIDELELKNNEYTKGSNNDHTVFFEEANKNKMFQEKKKV